MVTWVKNSNTCTCGNPSGNSRMRDTEFKDQYEKFRSAVAPVCEDCENRFISFTSVDSETDVRE